MRNIIPTEQIIPEVKETKPKITYFLIGTVVMLLLVIVLLGYQDMKLRKQLDIGSVDTYTNTVCKNDSEIEREVVYSNPNFNILFDLGDKIDVKDNSAYKQERANIVVSNIDTEVLIILADTVFAEGDPDYHFDEEPVYTKIINGNLWNVFHMTQSYADAGIESVKMNSAVLKILDKNILYTIYVKEPAIGSDGTLRFTDIQNKVIESIRFEE